MAERYDVFVSYAHRDRPEWVEALDWYRKSLAILEELGNRAGMAASYHHLGRVAEEEGSYDDALEWYGKALAIKGELGNRAGMASSLGQIGALLTKIGRPQEAVPWTLRSLALHLEMSVPELGIDLYWLGRQREALGKEQFDETLREHLDGETTATVLRMLDESGEQG